MNVSRIKEIGGVLFLSGGWVSMLLSVVFYLFFWRVDNEPGAKALPWSISSQLRAVVCHPDVGVASGSHAVPDASREANRLEEGP